MLRPPIDSNLYTLFWVCWHVWPSKNDIFVACLFSCTQGWDLPKHCKYHQMHKISILHPAGIIYNTNYIVCILIAYGWPCQYCM